MSITPLVIKACIATALVLQHFGIEYAVAGATACCLYGSTRYSGDVEFVIGVDGSHIIRLKQKVSLLDDRFNSPGTPILLFENAIRVEMLPFNASLSTWPVPLHLGSRILTVNNHRISVLRPMVIVFAKVNEMIYAHTLMLEARAVLPKTREQFSWNLLDVSFLARLCSPDDVKQCFALYDATKQRQIRTNLISLARTYPQLEPIATSIPDE